MNRATPSPLDDDEEELMRELVSEAGNPAVAPRPEFVAGLRETIFNRLEPERRARRRVRLLIGSVFAAAAVVAAVLTVSIFWPANAWAQVAKVLQAQAWVHSRTFGPDGKEVGEGWFSPKNRVIASRHGAEVEYHDAALRTLTKYVPTEETVYRLPEQKDRLSMGMDFYQALLDPKGPSKSPLPGMDLIGQSRRKVEEGGRTWEDVDLTLRVIAGDREHRMRFRLDLSTGLPHSCVFQSLEGPNGTTLFDYPEHGPADIYELGAPRTAKLVDRIPGDDLDLALAGLKAGRLRFDDYRGVMDWSDGMNAMQVYRKGRKWRVESLIPVVKDWTAIPKDADAAWWRKNLDSFTRMVSAICDGERVYYYSPEGNIFGKDAKVPKVKLHMTQALNLSDEPLMPWPDKFPEHISHTNVWQPSHDREILLEPKPDDGPPGTIRLRVRDTRSPDPKHPDLYKLWLDPARGYVALRSETGGFEPKIEFIDTMLMENLARSPSGFWYPTRVRRKTSDSDAEQVWKYFLDFETPIADDLFLPLR